MIDILSLSLFGCQLRANRKGLVGPSPPLYSDHLGARVALQQSLIFQMALVIILNLKVMGH